MESQQAQQIADFSKLSCELLQVIRGSRSTTWVSDKLGRSPNFVYRLESGERGISYLDFLKFAEACRLNLEPFFSCMGFDGEPEDHGALIRHLIGSTPTKKVAHYLSTNPSKISRIKNAKTVPPLPLVLYMIQLFQNRLLPTLEQIVDSTQLESLAKFRDQQQNEVKAHFENPDSAAVSIALNLTDYKQEPTLESLSKLVGISTQRVEQLLSLLCEAGIVVERESRFFYQPKSVIVEGSVKDKMTPIRHWLQRALQKCETIQMSNQVPKASMLTYNVFSLSPRRYINFNNQFRKSYEELVRAATQTTPNDDLPDNDSMFVLGMQLICLEKKEPDFKRYLSQ